MVTMRTISSRNSPNAIMSTSLKQSIGKTMSTRANIIIRNGDKGCDRMLYHHHDGDLLGNLIEQFIHDVPTGDADDFTAFLKDFTFEPWGYYTNEFEDAEVISADIDYMYYVSIYEGGKKKVVEGFKFPHPPISYTGYNSIASDDPWSGNKIYELFGSSRDFTEERIRKYWPQSFYYVYGVPEEELGGAPHPKTMEG